MTPASLESPVLATIVAYEVIVFQGQVFLVIFLNIFFVKFEVMTDVFVRSELEICRRLQDGVEEIIPLGSSSSVVLDSIENSTEVN